MEAVEHIVLGLSAALNVLLIVLLAHKKLSTKRRDLDQIVAALDEFQKRNGCVVIVQKIDPAQLLVWGSK